MVVGIDPDHVGIDLELEDRPQRRHPRGDLLAPGIARLALGEKDVGKIDRTELAAGDGAFGNRIRGLG